MTVNRLLVFGGNPGSASDLDGIVSALSLPASTTVARVVLPDHATDLDAMLLAVDRAVGPRTTESTAVLAYSFGSWLALQWGGSARPAFRSGGPRESDPRRREPRQRLEATASRASSWRCSRRSSRRGFVKKSFAPETAPRRG